MKTVITKSLDPKYNLALEEHLLTNCKEDFCFLWQSNNSVVIGKNQNTVDEINSEYVKENNVNVVRRITGGGAVYHDLGNINFSYIVNTYDKNNTFSKFTSSVIQALESYGIPAEFSGKNDILVNGMKISGNAQAIRDNRILHHGTLLFDSDLTKFGKILKPKTDKLESNGVSSIESRVTNILPYFKEGDVPTIAQFKDKLLKKLLQIRNEDSIMPINIYELSENDKSAIDYLIKNKYSTYNWNYNNIEVSEFNVNKYCRYEDGGGITFRLKIVDEQIENVKMFGDFLGYGDISDIEDSLKNITFQYSVVKKKLQKFDLKKYFGNITLDNILHCLFNNNNNNGKKNIGVNIRLLKKSISTELSSLVEYNKNRSIRMKFFNKNVREGGTDLPVDVKSDGSSRYYTIDHMWAKKEPTDNYRVGITDYAQNVLGEIVYVSLPNVGDNYNARQTCGEIESTKSVSEIFSPLTGTVVSINENLNDNPELLNTDPYGSGWIFEISISNANELTGLLSEDEYKRINSL